VIYTVRVYTKKGKYNCELVQKNIPVADKGKSHYFVGCNNGLIFYMANLKSILEGDIDLKDKNLAIKIVLNLYKKRNESNCSNIFYFFIIQLYARHSR
jgi:hypothetical protein